MKHLGDITKISGADATPVNVIIGGSPCQDLSVAGKRAGLAGERSGLFMEQLRVIKEMRKADADRGRTGTDIRPRFMVWENVPGAFSSSKGADFGAVLQETIRVICKKSPPIPMPDKGWPTAGCLVDVEGHWSVAWRVFDAQFWGVPQRRRRITLVADFGGLTAPEILFERKGVSGYYPQGRTPWETATRSVEDSFREAGSIELKQSTYCIQGNCIDRADTAGCNGKGWTKDVSYTLNTVDRPAVAPMNVPLANVASTLRAGAGMPKHDNNTLIVLNDQGGSSMSIEKECISPTLRAESHNNEPIVFHTTQDPITSRTATPCISAGSPSGQAVVGVNVGYVVRRLTPLECERLQGFPDGWTQIGKVTDYDRYQEFDNNGNLIYEFVEALYTYTDENGKKKKTTDSARYKALGNSIAIPPWYYVLQKLNLCCGVDNTMASLFDGIGGFPLIWEMLNGAGSCLWASEIEEFPIAVTKMRFPEEIPA